MLAHPIVPIAVFIKRVVGSQKRARRTVLAVCAKVSSSWSAECDERTLLSRPWLLRRNQAKRAGSRFLLTRLEKHTTLEGHGGCVNTTKFTNDGNLVITGSDDTNIKLWDWRTGECLLTVETLHTGNIFQATQLLHSSDSIVSCAADGQVQIHSLVHS